MSAASPVHERPWTRDQHDGAGRTTIRVKRACNGCGELLGDVTELEVGRAVAGLPLTDVRGECPRCSPELAS